MNSSILLQVFLLAVFVPLIYSYWNVHRAQHTEPKILYKKPLRSIWKKQYIPPQQAIDWSDPDMMQKPIDDIPRRTNRGLGEVCSYSTDCDSGCCLLNRATSIRSCQPRALRGDKCTLAQIKGDLYVDACPCLSGNDYCTYPANICRK
ncbi:uncharacterized protein LOC141849325 [Brevipalpus obovatus]|uniref:uncharacterized protein LOC141849325 n=1 Tax=Brevipalpus obovatus TaxID=246614 RepID=UPI003D9E07D9